MRGKGLPRWVDAVLAIAGLCAATPLLGPLWLLVRLTSRGPGFFRQVRVGMGGRPFWLVKLRSMTVADGGDQVTAGGDGRVTPLGRLLRQAKLDELPELWNVVVGDMSLVGPRPEVPGMVDLGDVRWRKVLMVRPGLTDPVTLSLRNEEELLAEAKRRTGDVEGFYRGCLLDWKLEESGAYLAVRTPWSDMKILGETVLAVVRGRGRDAPPFERLERTWRQRASAQCDGAEAGIMDRRVVR